MTDQLPPFDAVAEPDGTTNWRPRCYDCDNRFRRSDLQPTEVMHVPDDRIEYEYITVLLCYHCRRERFGWDCPHCGLTHESQEDARFCCDRRPGEAPDCIECGRRMRRGSWGYHADGTPTVEWAECDACSLGWGRFTGWHELDQDEGGEEA